jgi:DNA-binding SARP family transcriptional activator
VIPALAALHIADPAANAERLRALDALEASPPPPLAITLLGHFSVTRGGAPIDAATWLRPGVRQLLAYFALHRGQRLSRARMLRDLWPGNDDASASSAFRTAFSRLGAVIEPYLRDRATPRYFSLDAGTICFDPQRRLVTLDVDALDADVGNALAQPGAPLDDAPLATLLAALGRWRTPLGEARYADWALHRIEALTTRYADGCVRASVALRHRGRSQEAAQWAERATGAAPWQEGAWIALVHAIAAQGQRSLARRQAEQAVAILQRELGTPASEALLALISALRD